MLSTCPGAIAKMGPFEVVSDGSAIPVLAVKVKDPSKFTVFHVSEQLRMGGWQVPAYTMPANATDVAVLRIVVREGFGWTWPTTCWQPSARP